jgi:uncharacterized protein
MWIPRTLEQTLDAATNGLDLFAVWLLLGSRQVGKSSLLARLADGQRHIVNLDDLSVRARALSDPARFVAELKLPLLVDEIQYAPALLSEFKRLADGGAASGSIWLTGSQSFAVMRGVQESLAGRVAILNLFGLSEEEWPGEIGETNRAFFSRLLRSSFPKLAQVTNPAARDLYLASYEQTYIERDVRELIGVQKRREFELFVRLAALRTGQIINFSDLGKDAGISSVTAKQWLGILQDSFLIKLVQPYFSNRSKRLVKAPKLYFLDAGLAAHLAGWRDVDALLASSYSGNLFETFVFGQILRSFRHRAREVDIHYYRTRDGVEVDFLLDDGQRIIPIECKTGLPDARKLAKLAPLREARWADQGLVLSLAHTSEHRIDLNVDWQLGAARLAHHLAPL